MMKTPSNAALSLTRGRGPRSVNKASLTPPETDPLFQKIQYLRTMAANGDHQSQYKLDIMDKVSEPLLEFTATDGQRIMNKKYPHQIEMGIRLFRMMNKLSTLCEPVGNTVGIACRVRLINFENLSLNQLFEVRGQGTNLMARAALRFHKDKKFKGLDLLSAEEKDLYRRVDPYFGKRKKPTLKIVALGLLGEEDPLFSERNATNYVRKARKFSVMQKQVTGFGVYDIESVDKFNLDTRTGSEVFTDWLQRVRVYEKPLIQLSQHLASFSVRALQPLGESLVRAAAVVQPVVDHIALALSALPQFKVVRLAPPPSE